MQARTLFPSCHKRHNNCNKPQRVSDKRNGNSRISSNLRSKLMARRESAAAHLHFDPNHTSASAGASATPRARAGAGAGAGNGAGDTTNTNTTDANSTTGSDASASASASAGGGDGGGGGGGGSGMVRGVPLEPIDVISAVYTQILVRTYVHTHAPRALLCFF
jgi:hypothetical protein